MVAEALLLIGGHYPLVGRGGFGFPALTIGGVMRDRKQIEDDGTRVEFLLLEVLLDIRDLLAGKPVAVKKRRGRPPKSK